MLKNAWKTLRARRAPASAAPPAADAQRRLIFIPGMPRSGTTWFTRWLEEHPEVFAVHESSLIHHAIDMLEHLPRGGRLVGKEQLRSFLHTVYSDAAGNRNWIVDKSPGDLVYKGVVVPDLVLELFPEARVLYFYRDGKSFVYGQLNLPWKSRVGWDVEKATSYWIEQIQFLLGAPSDPRARVVRYEDLLREPQRGREIAEFLGLSPHGEIQPWAKPVNTVHRELDLDRWKTLDADSLAVMKRMNPYLIQCGYGPI